MTLPALDPLNLISPDRVPLFMIARLSRYAAESAIIPADAVLEAILAAVRGEMGIIRGGGGKPALSAPGLVSHRLDRCIDTIRKRSGDLWRSYEESIRNIADEDLHDSAVEAFLVMRLFETCPQDMIRSRPFMSINVAVRDPFSVEEEHGPIKIVRTTLAGIALYSGTAPLTPETWDLLYSPSTIGTPAATRSGVFFSVLRAALRGVIQVSSHLERPTESLPDPMLEAADSYLSGRPAESPAAKILFSRTLLEAVDSLAIPLNMPGLSFVARLSPNMGGRLSLNPRQIFEADAGKIAASLGYQPVDDMSPSERIALAVIHNAWKNRNEWFEKSEAAFAGMLCDDGKTGREFIPLQTLTRDEWRRFGGGRVYSRRINGRELPPDHPDGSRFSKRINTQAVIKSWLKPSFIPASREKDPDTISIGTFVSDIPKEDWNVGMRNAVRAAVRECLYVPHAPWGNVEEMLFRIPGEDARILDLFASEMMEYCKATGVRAIIYEILASVLGSSWIAPLAMERTDTEITGINEPVFFDFVMKCMEYCGGPTKTISGRSGNGRPDALSSKAERGMLLLVRDPKVQKRLEQFIDSGNEKRAEALINVIPSAMDRLYTLRAAHSADDLAPECC